MARIRWHGTTYSVEPIEKLPNGDWLMMANEHGPRFTIGTKIQVKAADIVDMNEHNPVKSAAESAAALEKAMAAERKELPSVQEMLAKAPTGHEAQGTGYDSGASGYELQGRRSTPETSA